MNVGVRHFHELGSEIMMMLLVQISHHYPLEINGTILFQ